MLQKRVDKSKSIFEQIERRKTWEWNTGKEELKYIYIKEGIEINDQVVAANLLCGKIIRAFKEKNFNLDLDFNESPIITFSNVFINKINILVKEERIDLEWLRNLTWLYVFQSDNKEQVKLGLTLAEKYLDVEELKKAVDVFVKSGEYIFYLGRAIKNLPKCNTYIMELLKISKGTIKIFALTNLEILSEGINTYLFEEGYKDKVYEELLTEYILTTGNIKAYLSKIKGEKAKINRFSCLVYSHLETYKLKDSPIIYALVIDYLPLALKGSSYISLICIVSIWRQLLSIKELKELREEFREEVEGSLKSDRWQRVFLNEVENGHYRIKDIIEIAEYYNKILSYEELEKFLKKNPRNITGYLYITMVGSDEDKLSLLNFFEASVGIESLLTGAENISTNEMLEDSEYIILALLISGCRDIYPRGKELGLKALQGKTKDIRNEGIKNISLYKEKLTEEEKEIVKLAMEHEPNYEIKNKLREICEDFEEGIVEIISTRGLKVTSHVKDVFILTSRVARSRYRNREYLKKELKASKVFSLVLEETNPYDKNAIKIVGASGFVIGYVQRKDNFILSNLLRGDRYLYCIVREYNLDNNYIEIKIYLSYKNIIKEAENLIQMMTSDGGDFEN